MTLLERVYFTKTQSGELVSQTTPPNDAEHILTIEVHQQIAENDTAIPNIEYHLYDNWSAPDLTGIHVVVTTRHNNSEMIGQRFRLDTRPHGLKNNFSAVLKWDPKDVVRAIAGIEVDIKDNVCGMLLFSRTKDWEIQYYGLIRELYRKCS